MSELVEDSLAARVFRLHTLEGLLSLFDGDFDLLIDSSFFIQVDGTFFLMSPSLGGLSLGNDPCFLEEADHAIVSIKFFIVAVILFEFLRAVAPS